MYKYVYTIHVCAFCTDLHVHVHVYAFCTDLHVQCMLMHVLTCTRNLREQCN